MDNTVAWQSSGDYTDIRYETAEGIAKITIDRPEVRNAFRPADPLRADPTRSSVARDDPTIGVIVLTGEGPDAFCSGGDQKIRGDDGYVDEHGIGRLNVLDLQIQIRRMPEAGGRDGRRLRDRRRPRAARVCDLTIAADNARFGQTGPRVGSFDGGYGIGLLARADRREAREESGSCAGSTTRATALDMGLVNTVVPLDELEDETVSVVPRDARALARSRCAC